MKNNKKIIIKVILMFILSICLVPTVALADEIGDIDIENVIFNYNPGDKPKASAIKLDPYDELYDIEYEYWEEMETNESGDVVPVKYWYSDENKNTALAEDKKITSFLEGKSYMYSISLKAKDGNTFATNNKVMVNGAYANNINVTNTGTKLFIVAVKTIKPKTIKYEHITLVEINNATINFKVGDKPVFSGKTPANVPYIYQSEYWSTDGGKKYYYAADFWNINNPDDLFTAFESGKKYTYGVYFKAAEGYCFTTDTKLKINGKYYDYDITDYDPMLQYNKGEYATMWVDTGLIITPTSSKNEIKSTSKINGSIIFENKLDKDYTLDINQIEIKKELSDKNIKYLVDINLLENGLIVKINNTKMKIKISLPEDLKGYKKYEAVYIKDNEIMETIEATVENGYIVFETSHLSEYGIVATEKISNNDVVTPKTSDNVILYLLSGTISLIILAGGIYRSKKMS